MLRIQFQSLGDPCCVTVVRAFIEGDYEINRNIEGISPVDNVSLKT